MPPQNKNKTDDNTSNVLVPEMTHKLLRGKRGGLQSLPNMPLDILLEVFQHLGPRDLLQLARTSKTLRRFLLNRRTSGGIWKTAMENAGDALLERLPFLSELAWINLLFSSHCHGYLKGNVKTILWDFGVRYCPSCKRTFMEKFRGIYSEYQVPEELLTPQTKHPDWLNASDGCVHIPELIQFLALWRETPKNMQKELVKDRVATVKRIREQALVCRDWMENKAQERSNELEEIRQKRIDHICLELQGIGWRSEIELLSEEDSKLFHSLPEVQQAKPLSARAWKGMRDRLVAFLEKKKAERLQREQVSIMVERLKELARYIAKACTPSSPLRWQAHDPILADIAMFPEVRAIVELPNEEEVAQSTFQSVVDALPALIARWHEDIKTQAGRKLRQAYEKIVQAKSEIRAGMEAHLQGIADADVVDLVTMDLFCSQCRRQLNEPSITGHSCGRGASTGWRELSEYSDLYLRAVITLCKCEPWSLGNIRWFITPYKIPQLRAAPGLCGLDSTTTTWKELAERKERFICACSSCDSPHKDVMNGHNLRTSELLTEHEPSALKLADPDLTAIAKAREDKLKQEMLVMESRSRHWLCARCMPVRERSSDEGWTRQKVRQHLIDLHGFKREEIHKEDLFLHPDYKRPLPSIRVLEDELKEYRRLCGEHPLTHCHK